MSRILVIDFSIFYAEAFNFINRPDEYVYNLRDNILLNNMFDIELLPTVNNIIHKFDSEKVHYLTRSKDIVEFISDSTDITIISSFTDTDDYYLDIKSSNWIAYLKDSNLLNSVTWLPSMYVCSDKSYKKPEYISLGCAAQDIEDYMVSNDNFDYLFVVMNPECTHQRAQTIFSKIATNIFETQGDTKVCISSIDDKTTSYATILCSDDYLNGVICLYYTLKRSNTKYNFTVLCSQNLSKEVYNVLKSYNIDYVLYDDNFYTNLNYNAMKIELFNLDYDKVCFLDPSIIIANNIDNIFELNNDIDTTIYSNIVTNCDSITADYLVTVLKPSKDIYSCLKGKLRECDDDYYKDILSISKKLIKAVTVPTINDATGNHSSILHNDFSNKYWFNKELNESLSYARHVIESYCNFAIHQLGNLID